MIPLELRKLPLEICAWPPTFEMRFAHRLPDPNRPGLWDIWELFELDGDRYRTHVFERKKIGYRDERGVHSGWYWVQRTGFVLPPEWR